MKKRAILLAFMALIVLSACNAKKAETENSGTFEITKNNGREATSNNVGLYKTGITYITDLDHDGNKENLRVEYKNEDSGPTIYIDDNALYVDEFADRPLTEWFAIVDINTQDEQSEIAVYDDGPSADPCTTFFAYKDGKITPIFSIDSYLVSNMYDPENMVLNTDMFKEDGIVTWNGRLSILQTWSAPMHLRLNSDNTVTLLDELFYPLQPDTSDEYFIPELLYPVLASKDRDSTSERTLIEPTRPIALDITDNVQWVHITTDNGSGWIDIENITDYLPEEYVEEFKNDRGWDIGHHLFDGLSFAG